MWEFKTETPTWLRVGDVIVALDKILFFRASQLNENQVLAVVKGEPPIHLDITIDALMEILGKRISKEN